MAGVTFDAVTKRFDDVAAVDSFSLDVADREFLVLLGPSGCGKTTVLRMLAGLDDPTSGSIRIGGEPVVDVDPKDRDVAMVFQSYALYPHMTVARNIEFPLASRGTPRDRRAAMVADTARLLGLEALLGRKPAQLSGGQRQRVALARAIVRQPQVFLMDEPLSNLDAKLRIQTRADIVELQHRLQTTTLYVTHDQVEAMTMADRIAVMNEGRLQQLGPPQEIYERPANVFVARFIGSPPMNTVDGVVAAGDGGGASVHLAGAEVALPAAVAAAAGGAGPVVVGLRPEDLALRPDGQLAATVAIVELLGHDVHVICRLEDGAMLVVRQGMAAARPRQGDAVRVAVDADRLALFGADGGRLTP